MRQLVISCSSNTNRVRLKNLALEEMTVNACLLRNGMPTEMYEYGDTIAINFDDGVTYTFVKDLFYSYLVD